jgi:L-alanine-DL-glutamate epimerase-like enolase superfamily enzyme
MRIESVRAWHLYHPSAVLVEDGTTPPLPPGAAGRRQLAVEVLTDEMVSGKAVGYAPPGAKTVVDESLGPMLVGQDPAIVGELWAEMMWTVRDFGRGGVALQAISTIDLALWDLRGRLEGLPVYEILGELRPSVIVYGSGGYTSVTIQDLVAEMLAFAEAGFGALKMKVGKGFGTKEQEDVDRVRAVREAVGSNVELYVDANGAYGVEQALRMSERFSALDVRLFEEPVPPDDLPGHTAVREGSPIPIAAGEHEYEVAGLRRLAEAGAADVLQPDVLRIGGITGWLQAASVAAEHGLPLMSHAAQLSSLQVGCATPGFAAAEYMNIQLEMDRMWYEDIPAPEGGRWAPFPDRPGLGVALRAEHPSP